METFSIAYLISVTIVISHLRKALEYWKFFDEIE